MLNRQKFPKSKQKLHVISKSKSPETLKIQRDPKEGHVEEKNKFTNLNKQNERLQNIKHTPKFYKFIFSESFGEYVG
jgi:hypothetical protein